jgi:hypothetical protein
MQRVSDHQRALRTHRNTTVPISQLPPEILLLIFCLCAPVPNRYFSDRDLAFSQTCRAWRIIALGHSYLWRAPVLFRPQLASEMLARAADCPLVIKASFLDSAQLDPVVVRALESGNIEKLTVSADRGTLETLIRLALEKSQRTLTHLNLGLASWRDEETKHGILLDRIVSQEMRFPHLRDLRLSGCKLSESFISQNLSNLTALALDLFSVGNHGTEVKTLVTILRKSPRLEELSLIGPLIDVPDSERPTKIPLKHLKRLELMKQNCKPSLTLLLNSLYMPALTRIELFVWEVRWYSLPDIGSAEMVEDFLHRLAEKIFADCQVHTFSYEVSSMIEFTASGALASGSNLLLSLRVGLHLPKSNHLKYQIPLFFPLDKSKICTITIAPVTLLHRSRLNTFWFKLGSNASIVEIHLASEAHIGFSRAVEEAMRAQHPQALFPSLRTVSIIRASLNKPELHGMYGMTQLRLFAMFLKQLEEAGRIIPRITLSRCVVANPAREVFRKFGIRNLPIVEREICDEQRWDSGFTRFQVDGDDLEVSKSHMMSQFL